MGKEEKERCDPVEPWAEVPPELQDIFVIHHLIMHQYYGTEAPLTDTLDHFVTIRNGISRAQ